jgi:hypothetical protein
VMRSCVMIEHADIYTLLMEEGFPREEKIGRINWLSRMLGCFLTAPAASNHAILGLASAVHTDLARAIVASKASHDLIERRFGVRTNTPDAGRLAQALTIELERVSR